MGKWLKRLFGNITSGGIIGICVGLPLGISVTVVDVNAIRPAFYEAVAAAIPVLLLAVVLLIRGEGNAMDQLEAPRRQRRVEAESILSAVQKETAEVEDIRGRTGGEDGTEAERIGRLLGRLQDAEGRLRRLLDGFNAQGSMAPVLVLLYMSFAVGTVGEVAALAALGSGDSNMATYLSTGLGVLGLLLLLVILERNAITRASSYRRIEDEFEEESAAQKQRKAA